MEKTVESGDGFTIKLMEYEPDLRHKRYYYRLTREGEVIQVGPWPDDDISMKRYLAKGYLLEPPKVKPAKPSKKYSCQVCGKQTNSLTTLINCLKSHNL